jgi:hypothetical protein
MNPGASRWGARGCCAEKPPTSRRGSVTFRLTPAANHTREAPDFTSGECHLQPTPSRVSVGVLRAGPARLKVMLPRDEPGGFWAGVGAGVA